MSRLLKALGRQVERDEGFTLIELLVVILIIGILAAVAIPLFLNQSGKAYDSNAVSLAKNAQITEQTYASDNNGSYVIGATAATLTGLTSIDPALTSAAANAAAVGTATASSPAFSVLTALPSGVTGPAGSTYSYIVASQAQTSGDIYYLGVTSAGQEYHMCSAGAGSGSPGNCTTTGNATGTAW